jgi:GNAT superfamily N-acetyltransferase
MSERLRVRLRQATVGDLSTILGLIDEAAGWLRVKDTDQWRKPWPNSAARDSRVLRGLREKVSWLVEDLSGIPVATVTCKRNPNPKLWDHGLWPGRAVYVSRLVVSRKYAGWGIGASLIDWAGERGRRDWSAQWIRIDVWTTNVKLHHYYQDQGFRPCGIAEAAHQDGYPSAALFQKPISEIDPAAAARFG